MSVDENDGFEEVVVNGRMCILSRRSLPADRLIRFVAAPDGSVVADLRRRLPGRGAHIEARRDAVELAVRRGLLKRALKRDVRAGPELADAVDAAFVRAAVGFLGLARKAGQLVSGAAKVDATVRSGQALAVLHASDGAPDGLRKLDQARHAAQVSGRSRAIPAYRSFTSDEMGLALGGVNVIHAAVLAGDAGSALLKRLEALAVYRGESSLCGSDDVAEDTPVQTAANEMAGHSDNAHGTDGGCGLDPAQEAEA